MKLLEGSDTQLKFHITEKLKCSGTETNVDLTQFDKVLLEMRYTTWIVEYEWTIDNWKWGEWTSYVIFTILSEATAWKVWAISCDVWWVKWTSRLRFNESTIIWEVLPSVKIPEWIAND